MAEQLPSYDELAARVAELESNLAASQEQQTAIASVLQTISHSAFDVDAVLNELAEQANIAGGRRYHEHCPAEGRVSPVHQYLSRAARQKPNYLSQTGHAGDADIPAIWALERATGRFRGTARD